jgi:hypothetical protein
MPVEFYRKLGMEHVEDQGPEKEEEEMTFASRTTEADEANDTKCASSPIRTSATVMTLPCPRLAWKHAAVFPQHPTKTFPRSPLPAPRSRLSLVLLSIHLTAHYPVICYAATGLTPCSVQVSSSRS